MQELTEKDIERIAEATATLDQRVKEQADRIAELEGALAGADARRRSEIERVRAHEEHLVHERDQRIMELERQLEELRCGDLPLYFDGQLPAARFVAFESHLAICTTCQSELRGLMQETVTTAQ